MKKKVLVLVAIINLGICQHNIYAQTSDNIGMVISAEGQVSAISKDNQERSLQRRSSIYLNDKIITKGASKAQLRLVDDSIVIVQPESEFFVSEFSFNKNIPDKNKYVGNLVKGALINISGQSEAKDYQVKSPLVTIAVRGTSFATRLNKTITNQEVYVSQGHVSVDQICKNIAGKCESNPVNIGADQQFNSAVVNLAKGKIDIKPTTSANLLSEGGIAGQGLMTQSGGVAVRCKAKR